MKIKHVIVMAVIVVIALVVTGCGVLTPAPNPNSYESYDAELLMPGNTIVTGECEQVVRISSGWIRLKINGTWYSCNEWRVVLKERD